MPHTIAMIGAGSFFTDSVTEGLCRQPDLFAGSTFTLVDSDDERLRLSLHRQEKIVREAGVDITLAATTDRRRALAGCDYVVTSFDRDRARTWLRDIEIPQASGVHCWLGENGGPGGQAHAMRNITVFMDIAKDMEELCPDAWLMNFTNPMSFVCTYMRRYTSIKTLGFCHQVHGSMGVVAEMLGYEPGDLEVISGGINHFNWLVDIRRKGSAESFMEAFKEKVLASEWWHRILPNVPEQIFTREILETFDAYPIGYDSHIAEYLPFFYDVDERARLGFPDHATHLKAFIAKRDALAVATDEEKQAAESMARSEFQNVPFPKDGTHPWYRELTTDVMEAFAANQPLHLTSIVIPNHGSIDNLPHDAIVDIPAVAIGGAVRGLHVGPLPPFAAELCRRQIAIHELLCEATVEGSRLKFRQSLALDPYVRSMSQARDIADAFLAEYRDDLPQFWS